MKALTLLELNQIIGRQLSAIQREFWVIAEIAQINFQQHAYLELVQQENGKIVAKSRAAIWASQLKVIQRKSGTLPENLLKKGVKALLLVSVNFHEVYGLSLVVSDVDLSFALGEMEQARKATLERLAAEGLLGRQRALPLPVVAQRVAVISSPDAAGYGDFMHQLAHNAYGYVFHTQLYAAQVQGEKAVAEISAQLAVAGAANHDIIVIIRGGGSKLDLAAFDEYELAKSVCLCPVAVLTGIGHQRDDSVCDQVAAASFKTPTAVAEFLISKMAAYESALLRLQERMLGHLRTVIQSGREMLAAYPRLLQKAIRFWLKDCSQHLIQTQSKLDRAAKGFLDYQKKRLEILQTKILSHDPQILLNRGYTMTFWEDKPLTALPPEGAVVKTITRYGDFLSRVQKSD